MAKLISVADYRRQARRVLPRMVYEYLEGGAEDEISLTDNRMALTRLRLQPKRLRDVSVRDQRVELFGQRVDAPFMVGPTGLNGAFRPRGDILLAKAAARAGVPFVLSTPAQNTIEEVAEQAPGNLWFQLYVVQRALAESLVARALSAGYRTLVLTTDVAVNGKREHDIRNGFEVPLRLGPQPILDGALHPLWALRLLRSGMPKLANFSSDAAGTAAQYAVMHRQMDAAFSWDDLVWLRRIWPHTLLVKGILNADDAVRSIDCGVDGVILSNHGGRQLDNVITPIEVLPEVVARTDRPVLIDSGFRRGSDIVKALALGAAMVLLGRAPLYGLAARGERGVDEVLALLKAEVDTTLALVGAASVRDLEPSYVVRS